MKPPIVQSAIEAAATELGRAYADVVRRRLQQEADAALASGADHDAVVEQVKRVAAAFPRFTPPG